MTLLNKVDIHVFQELNARLNLLQEQFESAVPRSPKDPLIERMILEARLEVLNRCFYTFSHLIEMMYDPMLPSGEEEGHHNEEETEQDRAISIVLFALYNEGLLTDKEYVDIIEFIGAAQFLSLDKGWWEMPEHLEVFDDYCKKLPRYYHILTNFSGMLSQRLSVVTEESEHELF